MALTTEQMQAQEPTESTGPAPPPKRTRPSTRVVVGWAAVVAAAAGTATLAVQVLTPDSTETTGVPSLIAEHGSIQAVEYAEVAARGESTPAICCPLIAEHGSIQAVEHAAETEQS